MKVTIDTQSDSMDDIKKLLHILTDVLEKKGQGTVATSSNVDTSNLMSMFSQEPETQPTREVADTPPNFSSFLNLTKRKEAQHDEPRVELY